MRGSPIGAAPVFLAVSLNSETLLLHTAGHQGRLPVPDRGPDDTALDITGVRQSSGDYSAHEQDPREPCATVGLPGMRVHGDLPEPADWALQVMHRVPARRGRKGLQRPVGNRTRLRRGFARDRGGETRVRHAGAAQCEAMSAIWVEGQGRALVNG